MTKRKRCCLWLLLLLAALLFLSGCRAKADLVGAWQASWFDESLNGTVTLTYRFSQDGTVLVEGDGFSLPFGAYSAEGGTLTLTGDDDSRSEFSYAVDGDALILYYTDGSEYLSLERIE